MFTFDHFWAGLLSLASFVLGLLHLGHRREMQAMKDDLAEAKRLATDAATGLGKHQLYAAETYALKRDVERAVEQSEARLSKQLEGLVERVEEIRDRLPRRN